MRKELWTDIVSIIEGYLDENEKADTPVVNYVKATELKKTLNLKLSNDSCDYNELLDEVKTYLKYSTRTSHPQFNNQLNGGFHFEAMIGELVAFIGNATMATYEVAPMATLLEDKLVEEINKIIGFDNGSGIMLTGGSNANLMAIHCAREKAFPDSKNKGNQGRDYCVYVSDQAHYSHRKAMMLMGLGLDNLITIESDEFGKMKPSDLKIKIQASLDAGKTPLMICSTVGTTVLGAFDPVKEINIVAKEFNLWHHLDGAWGGAVMFSKKYKHLLDGIEDADSYTFDAHKLMGAGLITSFFTTKHKGILDTANSGGGSQYIFHEYENADFDTGRRSLQCGRKVDSLKFWLMWKAKGHKGFEEFVDGQYEKQNYLVSLIKENPRLKLIRDPEFLNVCFQVIPEDKNEDINQYNYDLRFKLVREGKMLTNFSRFEDGTIFFRHVFANNVTQKTDLKNLIEHILSL